MQNKLKIEIEIETRRNLKLKIIIMDFFNKLDEHNLFGATFVAQNLRRVPVIDPSSIDMCCLLEIVEEMKKKIDSLCDIKKQVADFSAVVSGQPMRQSQTTSLSTSHAAPAQAFGSQLNRT